MRIDQYREINKNITQKIRITKETWPKDKCENLETLHRKYKFNLHRKVKEMAGINKSQYTNVLTDQNDKIIAFWLLIR